MKRKQVIMCELHKSQHYGYPCAQKLDKHIDGYAKTARCNACLKQIMDDEFKKPTVDHSVGYK